MTLDLFPGDSLPGGNLKVQMLTGAGLVDELMAERRQAATREDGAPECQYQSTSTRVPVPDVLALLAYLSDEPGAEMVEDALKEGARCSEASDLIETCTV